MAIFVADEQATPVDVERLNRLAAHVLADRRVPAAMELSILCLDADSIAALNGHHMGAQGPTDVLAFPIDLPGESLAGEPSLLGDVVLCPEVAARQAREHGTSLTAELDLLLVHGILHLLGHDHDDADERREMVALTDRLLTGFRAGESPP
ncbi:MAG TPA: rRNA maturation RNase YbeY [Egibacteraceae bacterium]|nr:rRNA maturation RNase YbeY [Actinomycetota bacterium]HWB72854.1 rRNA maturation RNase YbeY [Egibacteraceae bacterium]